MTEFENKLMEILKSIQSDAKECQKQADAHKEEGDKLNEYLMSTIAMAHSLDSHRIQCAFPNLSSNPPVK